MSAVQPFSEKLSAKLNDMREVLRPAERLRQQAHALGGHLGKGDSVLDVGCGTGYLSAYLQQMYGISPSGIDVKDARRTEIPFREFNGTSIPFPDRAFDHVVLSEVLHHSHDPVALIKQCYRVARRSIIVFEDMPDGRLGKGILFLHVHAFARYYRYPFPPATIGSYRSALNWLGDNSSCVLQVRQPPEWLSAYPRELFVYELAESAQR
ncbi:Ubiquinone biosynthesis O-methyltransferase [Mycobacterium marinum]|uniref:class I SAM-dependent methyltransferase n=1 Tax=Mycobacterium marinum TaxID=1781 RepID=UPI000E28BE92|nr:class I SAM-dependent methyltransferase [Mycobacterium marinum]AXN45348.1 Ubiquinone biosynthesis O-methyltransferase [Mycobacterium marinum]RFZ02434.1 Ubiquinone biosynthesis O-methyltransferase [Mycobacterium marinum]WCS16560.1 class I SAM-dependent methyltransferase [Mycobacterium marinum]